MCLIVIKPANVTLPRNLFVKANSVNPHGAGFTFAKRNRLHCHKGYRNMRQMWADFIRLTNNQRLPALLHWRFATHGSLGDENTQPFVMKHAAIAHNGIINWCNEEGSIWTAEKGLTVQSRSDSRVLAEDVLHDMTKDELAAASKVLARTIAWSKLAFLHPDGSHSIVEGTSRGKWKDGAWYSNTNHEYDIMSHVSTGSVGYTGTYATSKHKRREDAEAAFGLDDFKTPRGSESLGTYNGMTVVALDALDRADDDDMGAEAIADSFAPSHGLHGDLKGGFTDAELMAMGVDPEDEEAVARLETLPFAH